MNPMKLSRTIALALCLAAGTAYAHPGHGPTGFAGGLAHLLLGLGLFAIVAIGTIAIGLWAAKKGRPVAVGGAGHCFTVKPSVVTMSSPSSGSSSA